MKFILATKLGMTQVFRNDGTVVPVTRVSAGPCVVTQIKAQGEDRINAVQLGFGSQKLWRLSKAEQGHLDGLATVRYLRDVRTGSDEHGLKRGDTLTVKMFAPGEKVQVVGTSKGKGFQGVVKRHGFKGGPASHGHKDNLRMPGSIGAGGVQRVFKDMRMAGRMGGGSVTVKNLEIMSVDPQTNELLIKGALPGARGTLLVITTPDGKIEVEQMAEPAPVVVEANETIAPAEAVVETAVPVSETPAQS